MKKALQARPLTLFASIAIMWIAVIIPGLINTKFSPAPAQDQSSSGCEARNMAFESGEELTYVIYYNWNFVWIPAGEATFRVSDNGSQYYITAGGRTYKSYEWMYKVNDRFETFVDKNTLLPSVSIRDLSEGNYRVYEKTAFDRKKLKATHRKGKSAADITNKPAVYDVSECVHDILSAVYYMRNMDYSTRNKGDQVPVQVFLDGKVYPLGITYIGTGRSTIKGLGRFNTVQVVGELIAGNSFKEGDKMTIWATDDNNRLPLLIEAPLQIGSVKCVLKSHKNLRHPMSSRL